MSSESHYKVTLLSARMPDDCKFASAFLAKPLKYTHGSGSWLEPVREQENHDAVEDLRSFLFPPQRAVCRYVVCAVYGVTITCMSSLGQS